MPVFHFWLADGCARWDGDRVNVSPAFGLLTTPPMQTQLQLAVRCYYIYTVYVIHYIYLYILMSGCGAGGPSYAPFGEGWDEMDESLAWL